MADQKCRGQHCLRHRLGVSLARTGRLDDAVTALEKALTGKAAKIDYPQVGSISATPCWSKRRLEREDKTEEAEKQAARGHATGPGG